MNTEGTGLGDQPTSKRVNAVPPGANFVVRPLADEDAPWVETLLNRYWASPRVYARGRVIDASTLPGFAAFRDDEAIGLITYLIENDECEIVTHNSLAGSGGIGSCLLAEVRGQARQRGCKRLWLVTTNDNTAALRFYQRRDFEIAAFHKDSLRHGRTLKNDIPDRGHADIPIRHELELQFTL
jgi:GNAT superfamily N-acetyltransferase